MADNVFQDDQREREMRQIFGLTKDETEGRSGIDAYLQLDGKLYPFELKTTSKGSVTTVRDFGHEHIRKWKNKHWLIGFYKNNSVTFKYGSPKSMDLWIREKEDYISPDFALSDIIRSKMELPDLYKILGEKPQYTLDDAKRIQKKQYSSEKYRDLMDTVNGYTPNAMLNILRDRAAYIIERGSTLNNPHIPESYFFNFPIIDSDHVQTLKRLVKEAIS
jgi:hypothetical protein